MIGLAGQFKHKKRMTNVTPLYLLLHLSTLLPYHYRLPLLL